MKKVLVRAAAVAGALVIGTTGAALAAPSEQGVCRQGAQDFVMATWGGPEGTRGDAISDGLYGNEPNVVDPYVQDIGPEQLEPGTKDGRIVGSASPGPALISGGTGISVGDFRQAVNAVCNA